VVYRKQHLQGMETKWVLIVDPRKAYVPLLLMFSVLVTNPDSVAGSGKSVLTCVA
jgi:hypothetical protein